MARNNTGRSQETHSDLDPVLVTDSLPQQAADRNVEHIKVDINKNAAEMSLSGTRKDLPGFELTLEEFTSGRVQSRRRRSSLVHRLSGGSRRTGRRFSLTKAEAALISALDKKEEEKEKEKEAEEEEGATKGCTAESAATETAAASSSSPEESARPHRGRAARSRLRSSIASRRSSLTPEESEFLERLADAEGVEDAAILSSAKVLETDELYNPGEPKKEDAGEEDEEGTTKIDPSPDNGKPRRVVRSRPRGSIASRRTSLTPAELKFLDRLGDDGEENEENGLKTKACPSAESAATKMPSSPSKEDDVRPSFMNRTQGSFLSYVATLVGRCTAEQGGTLDWVSESDGDDNDDDSLDSEPRERLGTIPFQILGTSADQESDGSHPHVLSPPLMDTLRLHMPYAIQEDNFWLKFSLAQDGASLDTLLYKVRSSTHTVLAIETVHGEVLGSFTSSPWRRRGDSTYYGSGEAFLWRMRRPRSTPCGSTEERVELESDVETFPWTGENRNVQLFGPGRLIVGGGEPDKVIEERVAAVNREEDGKEEKKEEKEEKGFGLTLNSDLSVGTSGECVTFGSPGLSKLTDDSFDVLNIEVWTLTPMADIENAVKLELSRQFVHSSNMESQMNKHNNASRAM